MQHFVVSLQFHVQPELQPPKAVNQNVAGGALSYPLKTAETGGGRFTRTQGIWLNVADCFARQKAQKSGEVLASQTLHKIPFNAKQSHVLGAAPLRPHIKQFRFIFSYYRIHNFNLNS